MTPPKQKGHRASNRRSAHFFRRPNCEGFCFKGTEAEGVGGFLCWVRPNPAPKGSRNMWGLPCFLFEGTKFRHLGNMKNNRTHVAFPYHKDIDREEQPQRKLFGTPFEVPCEFGLLPQGTATLRAFMYQLASPRNDARWMLKLTLPGNQRILAPFLNLFFHFAIAFSTQDSPLHFVGLPRDWSKSCKGPPAPAGNL